MAVLVTGATRGLGRGLFDHYARTGAEVFGTYRTTPPAVSGRWIPLDLHDPDSVKAMGAALDGVSLDLLVCNAGVYADKGMKLSDGFPPRVWADTFAVNVTGVFLTIQTLLPQLQAAASPRIAILSSRMGSSERAPGGSYVYRASKAAVTNLGRNLASDLEPLGIAVGIYHPGWVRTEMGGPDAELSPEDAVAGLTARFAELDLASTGCVRGHDGADIPF